MTRPGLLAAALLALSLAAGARAELPELFLGSFPLERAAGVDLSAERLRITLELNPGAEQKASGLSAWASDAKAAQSLLSFTVGRAPVAAGKPTEALRASTFLVDHADPAVQKLQAGKAKDLAALIDLVDRHITKKNLSRLQDTASVVALRGEGDCTEHAVLLAAVARASGRPARVVFGLLLVELGDHTMALGHAWVEVYDGGRWQLADATRPPADRVRYVPLSAFTNEGPGYAVANFAQLSPIDVRKVRLEPAAAPVASPALP